MKKLISCTILFASVAAGADPFTEFLGKYLVEGAVEIISEGGVSCDRPAFAQLKSVEFVSHGAYSSVLLTGAGSRAGIGLEEYSSREVDDPSTETKSENTGGPGLARNTRSSYSRLESERQILQIRGGGPIYEFEYSLQMFKGKLFSGSCTYRAALRKASLRFNDGGGGLGVRPPPVR